MASARTHIERTFDPEGFRRVKEAAGAGITIGGAELALAGQAIAAELVDELHPFLRPIIVGGGKRALPDDIRVPLARLDEHRSETASFTSTTALAADTRRPPRGN